MGYNGSITDWEDTMGFGLSVLYTAVLGMVSHYVGQALPRRWFDPTRFPYRSFAWEKEGTVYRRVGVHKWKDLVPDMSKVMPDMIPKRVGCGRHRRRPWCWCRRPAWPRRCMAR